jgi:hypothetical protein
MRSLVYGFGILLSISTPAVSEITWRENYFNPAPLNGDLVLPMPCGGAMTFRRVDTPNFDGAIGDVSVTLGQEGNAQPYLNGLRRAYVSGAFSDDGDLSETAKGYFFLGKYELAQAQYDAVIQPACPDKAPRKRAFIPATSLTKLELEGFAENYTTWLMALEGNPLPTAGSTQGYIRLPTEQEWEFGVRGGLAVENALFRAPLPPIPAGGDYSEYIAHGGTESAGGKVQVIGTLKPNELGLHDMLGNASEVVGTAFSLVRHGRLHGQTGGFIKRGGDARTPISKITSATRFEVPPYDAVKNAPSRDRYSSTRMAISGLSITSAEQADLLVAALEDMAKVDEQLPSAQSEVEVLAIIDTMSQNATTAQNKQKLALIRDTIQKGRAERNAQRDRSIKLILESGTLMCNQVVQRFLNALAIRAVLPSYNEIEVEAIATGDDVLLFEVREAIAEAERGINEMSLLMEREILDYANLMEGLAEEYSINLLKSQAAIIAPDIEARSNRRMNCLTMLRTHLASRQVAGFSDIELVTLDFQGLALTEADE